MTETHDQNNPANHRCSSCSDASANQYFVSGCWTGERTLVTLNPGQKLAHDRFTIKKLLGSGSVGRVYLAADTMRAEEVALKIVDIGPLGDSGLETQIKKGNAAAHEDNGLSPRHKSV